MDPFALPRATFTFYLKLAQLPFEVGMRLLGGGDGDRVEAPAEQPRRASKPRRQRAPKSGRRPASRSGQARRRGQARPTAARQRQAPERPPERDDSSVRGEPAVEDVQSRIDAAQDLQEGIEAARGEAAASQREATPSAEDTADPLR